MEIQNSGPVLLKGTRHTNPKVPLQGRIDVFKLYPSFEKIVIIMVFLYFKELYRGCYISASALSHTFALVVWTQEKQV